MTNCVHPKVVAKALSQTYNQTAIVEKRFNGIQANTSPLSPEELDSCYDLKTLTLKFLVVAVVQMILTRMKLPKS